MTTFPLVKVLSYLTYASVLFHVVDGFVLVLQNRKARPTRYAVEKGSANSGWSSRNMAVLGTIVLVFIVTHMQNFWWKMHFGNMPEQTDGLKDLHKVVLNFFDPGVNSMALAATTLYVLGMAGLGFHLWHGFGSAFQSLGLRHDGYTPLIEKVGRHLLSSCLPPLPLFRCISF